MKPANTQPNLPGFTRFAEVYTAALKTAHAEHPEIYTFPASELPIVTEQMLAAWRRGSASNTGPAIKATCKALGIKTTYKAIRAYLETGTSV